MAGLLKYFKRAHKKDSTLPDPDGPLSRDIPSSSIGITNTRVRQVQQEASSERRSRGPYILLTPAQVFCRKKSGKKRHNCNTVLLF